MHGQPVLEAMHAARILGDVAADRARDLRGRIRRVVHAVRRSRLGHREVRDAGLHACETAARIDFEDFVEPRQHQQQPARDRQRAARESGARAACDHWHRIPMTGTDDLLDLLDARRQRDQVGRVTVGGEGVALVGDAGFGSREQARSENRAEFAQQSCVNGHWAAGSARRRPCRSRARPRRVARTGRW